ncbi:hypothetical protein BDC45DRAFT_576609 [Circinella umbellata]|nr:hypothetical protein BDC45DRAFT_576609 [Circinella umbellata]
MITPSCFRRSCTTGKARLRPQFFSSLLRLPCFIDFSGNSIIVGDFNLHLSNTLPIGIQPWTQFLLDHCTNCLYPNERPGVLSPHRAAPTYTSSSHQTTIDYIFTASTNISNIIQRNQLWLSSNWTDHDLLSIDLLLNNVEIGPGTWRFNPLLLDEEPFCKLLATTIHGFFTQAALAPQDLTKDWDNFKLVMKETARDFTRRTTITTKVHLRQLQRSRQQLLASQDINLHALHNIEQDISKLEEQQTKQLLLRSATRWHEQGECNNKYFYNVIKERNKAITISTLRDPVTGLMTTSPAHILKIAHQFYSKLFATEPIYDHAIDDLLSTIPSSLQLTELQQNRLTAHPLISPRHESNESTDDINKAINNITEK